MTTMTSNLLPKTTTPTFFQRILNWFRGDKPVADATTEAPVSENTPATILEEGGLELNENSTAPIPEASFGETATSAIRALMETDHSGRGYHEGLSRGDKHFMELSVAQICAELEEAIRDAIDQNQTNLARLVHQQNKLQELGLEDVALKFGPRMERTAIDIEMLQEQLTLVPKGEGWANLPVTTYRNAFHKAQTEKAEQLLQRLSKPLP